MTRAEKVAQLGSFWAFEVVPESGFDAARLAALGRRRHRPDHPAGGLDQPAPDRGGRRRPTRSSATSSRRRGSGIPTIIHEECLHGLIAWAAPCFQQSIGAAASFDPDVVTAMAATIRRRMLLTGARHALAPVLDIARDPRWGRIEETYGEDPYLAAALGCAYIEALQGPDLAEGVDRHGQAHGRPRAGRGRHEPGAGAHRRARAARRAAVPVRGGGPPLRASRASCRPTATSTACRATPRRRCSPAILRGEWGFDGIVASDYIGVEMISTAHKLTADLGEAARLALVAGVDAELPRTVAFGPPLEAALEDGRVERRRPRRHRRARPPDEVPPRAVRRSRTSRSRTRRPSRRSPPTRRAPPARSPSARWSWSRTTGSCRCARTAGASRSSGRSPTARATCSATTATWSTWRPCARCTRASTRSASSARAR